MKPIKQDKPEAVGLFNRHIILREIIDLSHPLVCLAERIDWDAIEQRLLVLYDENTDGTMKPIRLMAGLCYLKHTYNLSDEVLLERWVENPYYQYFCGEQIFQYRFPIHRTTLTHFRNRLGQEELEFLLSATLRCALSSGALQEEEVRDIVVDTTVQEKAIAFPTDARLCSKGVKLALKVAAQCGVSVPHADELQKEMSALLRRHSGYAHARQNKRARKVVRQMQATLEKVTRTVCRKIAKTRTTVTQHPALTTINRYLTQPSRGPERVYSLHEPEVSCISKGKSHKRYEFGNKVSIVTTNQNSWILAAVSHAGNPFDGHTLPEVLERTTQILSQANIREAIKEAVLDKGYKGNKGTICGINIHLQTRAEYRKAKAAGEETFRKFQRRSSIEPIIGHMKNDGRLGRNYLKGTHGDMVNALLSACGQNLRKLLKYLKNIFALILCRKILTTFPPPIRNIAAIWSGKCVSACG